MYQKSYTFSIILICDSINFYNRAIPHTSFINVFSWKISTFSVIFRFCDFWYILYIRNGWYPEWDDIEGSTTGSFKRAKPLRLNRSQSSRRRLVGERRVGSDRQWGWYRGIASWHALCVPSNDERLPAPSTPFPGVGMIPRPDESADYLCACRNFCTEQFERFEVLIFFGEKSANHLTLNCRQKVNEFFPSQSSLNAFYLILIMFKTN